jgi:hypothetical protein
MPETNPYAPPDARPEIRGDRVLSGPVRMALRAVAVVWGFTLLAGPARQEPNSAVQEGQLLAKTCGAILMVAAFFPFGEQRKSPARDVGPEEL